MARRRGYHVKLCSKTLVDIGGDLERKLALVALPRALAERPHTTVGLLTKL